MKGVLDQIMLLGHHTRYKIYFYRVINVSTLMVLNNALKRSMNTKKRIALVT